MVGFALSCGTSFLLSMASNCCVLSFFFFTCSLAPAFLLKPTKWLFVLLSKKTLPLSFFFFLLSTTITTIYIDIDMDIRLAFGWRGLFLVVLRLN